MLLLFAFFFYALGNTAWGKHVYATGDDIEAARLAGIRTDRVLLSVYTVAGLLYAIGAWILIGRLASASPNVGIEYNLDSITAVVLGGTSLFGGRGLVLGTLIGALIVGVFRNGLQLARRRGRVAGLRDRPARAHRRLPRPVDQEGEGMTTTETSLDKDTGRGPAAGAGAAGQGPGQALRPGHRDRQQRPRALPRRDPRRDRRQRRRQDQPDQGAVRGADPGQRRDPPRRPAGPLQEPDGRPRGRHRDRLPVPRRRARPRHRRQPVPRPRGAQARHARLGVPDARQEAHARRGSGT